MAQIVLSVHTLVSYTFSGVLFSFILVMLILKWGKLHHPRVRIGLLGMTMFIPLISYFVTRLYTTSDVKIPVFDRFFWFLCQIGNLASALAWPLLTVVAVLLIFHLLVVVQCNLSFRRLPRLESFQGVNLEEIVGQLAEEMKTKKPVLSYWPGPEPKIFTTGYVRPAIIISHGLLESVSERELKCVLAHELAHIKHRDTWRILILAIIRDIFFFMPLVYLISKLISWEIEKAADLLASRREPALYAATLLKIYRLKTSPDRSNLGVAFGGGPLVARLEAILDPPVLPGMLKMVSAMLVIASLVMYLVSLVC